MFAAAVAGRGRYFRTLLGYGRGVSQAPIQPVVPYFEYEAMQLATGFRLEYVDGYVRVMAGGSGRHDVIAQNLANATRTAAREAGCHTYIADRRLDLGGSLDVPRRSYYPDVMVVCGADLDAPGDRDPCFVAEVSSESTQAVDQLEKYTAYTNLSSVLAYAVVSQSERRVTLHRRVGGEFHTEHFGVGESFTLECPTVTIAVDDLYTDT